MEAFVELAKNVEVEAYRAEGAFHIEEAAFRIGLEVRYEEDIGEGAFHTAVMVQIGEEDVRSLEEDQP